MVSSTSPMGSLSTEWMMGVNLPEAPIHNPLLPLASRVADGDCQEIDLENSKLGDHGYIHPTGGPANTSGGSLQRETTFGVSSRRRKAPASVTGNFSSVFGPALIAFIATVIFALSMTHRVNYAKPYAIDDSTLETMMRRGRETAARAVSLLTTAVSEQTTLPPRNPNTAVSSEQEIPVRKKNRKTEKQVEPAVKETDSANSTPQETVHSDPIASGLHHCVSIQNDMSIVQQFVPTFHNLNAMFHDPQNEYQGLANSYSLLVQHTMRIAGTSAARNLLEALMKIVPRSRPRPTGLPLDRQMSDFWQSLRLNRMLCTNHYSNTDTSGNARRSLEFLPSDGMAEVQQNIASAAQNYLEASRERILAELASRSALEMLNALKCKSTSTEHGQLNPETERVLGMVDIGTVDLELEESVAQAFHHLYYNTLAVEVESLASLETLVGRAVPYMHTLDVLSGFYVPHVGICQVFHAWDTCDGLIAAGEQSWEYLRSTSHLFANIETARRNPKDQ